MEEGIYLCKVLPWRLIVLPGMSAGQRRRADEGPREVGAELLAGCVGLSWAAALVRVQASMPQICAIYLQALAASASEASVTPEDSAWSDTRRAGVICSLQLAEHQRDPEQWQLVGIHAGTAVNIQMG